MPHNSIWIDVLAWLKHVDQHVPQQYPDELPPAEDPSLWLVAQKLEMSIRDKLSDLIRTLLSTGECPPMNPLEAWFYRRRVEWAAQLVCWKVNECVEPNSTIHDVLKWLLVTSWESDGCIAFWNACERGGQPHPDRPQWMAGL